jgi:hypothetical protein
MPAILDLEGKVFGNGQITVLRILRNRSGHGKVRWICVCRCGKRFSVIGSALVSGNTKSCGCTKSTRISESKTLHGHNRSNKLRSSTYGSWCAMKQRCSNNKNKRWKNYGASKVSVCKRWMKFENFLADMGERPEGKTLGRFKDKGNYEPGNVRWCTSKEQGADRRGRKYVDR